MSVVLISITQSGSASATLHLEQGDTITLELNETVQNPVAAQAVSQMQTVLGNFGITVVLNPAGGAT
jgi:hypothetical protein